MQTLAAQIQSGELSRFHLIYGEESYMIRFYKNKLKSMLSAEGDDMNASFFEGNRIHIPEILSLGNTLPFFADKRLILMENSELFTSSNELSEQLGDFPDTTYVVFIEKKVDKRNRLYKWLQKNGCVTECAFQQEKDLIPWAARYLKNEGKVISRQTMEYLIAKVGFQMDYIVNELDKLIGYVGEREEIRKEDVDTMSSGQVVEKIFDMIDCAIAGEKERVFRLYGDLLALKEPPLVILHLLGRHINIMIQVKEAGKSLSDRDLAAQAGIPYFTVKKYKSQAKHFTKQELFQLLEERVEYEERFKTGQIEEKMVAEMYLLRLLIRQI